MKGTAHRTSLFILAFLSILVFLGLTAGCNDFMTKDVVLGGGKASSSSAGSSSSDSGDGGEAAPDDDADGISNPVEAVFQMDPRTSDTDFDGFGDGLEFVGVLGDPLNEGSSPIRARRARTLSSPASEIDSDKDGLGDTFEDNFGLDPEAPDTDADGYSDGLELVSGSDPLDETDRPVRNQPPVSDGISRPGTPPSDRDSDGLSDEIENRLGGRIDLADTDGDGFSDGLEYLMGSGISDALSVPNFSPPDNASSPDGSVV